tara:strand:+ start:2082 stop:2633 length:552 start_codon:yes stop_codon:yes gene_type:complete
MPMTDPANDIAPFGDRTSFSYEDLLECGHGRLFGPGNAQLPLPPMLMFDRITSISADGGAHGKGEVVAELDIKPDLWFFPCHFEGDPVMPGCLGLDALWQLTGFFLGWTGAPGRGRALGVGGVKFNGQVTPDAKLLTYRIDLKRVLRRGFAIGIADGMLDVDGTTVYETQDLKVGVFTSTEDM